MLTCPSAHRALKCLAPSHQSARSVIRVHSGGLPCRGDIGEGGVVEPGILKAEVGQFGNRSGDGSYKRDVIRGDAHVGGEGGIGEGGAECIVDQSTIKVSEGWAFTFVTPSEEAIKEGEFQESERVDSVIEASSKHTVKAEGVLVNCGMGEVVVIHQKLRNGVVHLDRCKF